VLEATYIQAVILRYHSDAWGDIALKARFIEWERVSPASEWGITIIIGVSLEDYILTTQVSFFLKQGRNNGRRDSFIEYGGSEFVIVGLDTSANNLDAQLLSAPLTLIPLGVHVDD
jgi:hypothetical protein